MATLDGLDKGDAGYVSKGPNAAAIGGGVGGGVAALLIVGLFIWYFVRRNKRMQLARDTTPPQTAKLAPPAEESKAGTSILVPELPLNQDKPSQPPPYMAHQEQP